MTEEDEPDYLPPKEEVIPPGLAKKWNERDSGEKLARCPQCRKQILASSSICAYCGSTVSAGRPAWVTILAALLILFSLLFFLRRWV